MVLFSKSKTKDCILKVQESQWSRNHWGWSVHSSSTFRFRGQGNLVNPRDEKTESWTEFLQIRNHAWLTAGAREVKHTAPKHRQSWHTFEKWHKIPQKEGRGCGLGASTVLSEYWKGGEKSRDLNQLTEEFDLFFGGWRGGDTSHFLLFEHSLVICQKSLKSKSCRSSPSKILFSLP